MEAKFTVLNYTNMKEKEFELPYDTNDMREFFEDMSYVECEITDVEDKYNFLMKIQAYDTPMKYINELVEKIEDTNCLNDTILKLKFHYENNSATVKDMINDFDNILEKYELYTNIENEKDWVRIYNNEYNFININDFENVSRFFQFDNRDYFLRDIFATYDFSESDIERYYKLDIYDILKEFVDIGLYSELVNSFLSSYIDWEIVVENLRASAFYVDTIDNSIIVHSG